MSEPGPEPMLPYGPPDPIQPAQPYAQPTFQQPSWETPGPTYSAPPAPVPYAAPVYSQPGVPAEPTYTWGYLVNHPQSTTAMVLGIVSLVGVLTCQLLLVLGPVAWIMGAKARREINREPQRYTGRSSATAGMVMGIISTVLMVLGILGLALLFAYGGADD